MDDKTSTDDLAASAQGAIDEASSLADLEALRVRLLGKKGAVTAQLKLLGGLAAEERKARGKALNEVKNRITEWLEIAARGVGGGGVGGATSARRNRCYFARSRR